MKFNSLLSVLTTLFFFAAYSAAWTWEGSFGDKIEGLLLPRQNNNNNNNNNNQNTESASQTASVSNSASGSASGSQGSGSATASGSGSASGSASGSGTASRSGSGSGTITGSATRTGNASGSGSRNSTKTSAIDPRLPPGGVQMITPAAIAPMTFVKVGDQITFAWNYTSLSVPPSYVDIVATNTINSQTYTIAGNASWEATQTVTWDTGDFAASNTLPFVVATYTLMVYDAASEPTAVASAGYLGAFANFQFGVYTPQPYTPLNDFRCASCSGAMSMHEKQALSVLLGTCILTILSFTWFAAGFGVF